MNHEHHSYKATIKKLADTGEVEIKSSVSAAEFTEAVQKTLADIKKNIELPGFRKGTVPEKLAREKIGDAALLQEAAEHAISHAYGHILSAEKIDAVGYPKVSVTKIAEGNPLEFTIVTAVVPEIKNFDYVNIAADENKKEVAVTETTDAEVEKTLESIKKANPKEEIKDVENIKKNIRENLEQEKKHRAIEKRRLELVDALTSKLNIVIPEVLVTVELERMTEQMKHDIERMGLKFEDYLKHLKKSADELKKEWKIDALKRVKLDLILSHIAREEKISADKTKVDAEIKHTQEHHKDVDIDRARNYFEHIFLNQAVFEFLDKQK